MIIQDGDIFELPAEALVNPVNCVGVMGKGLAAAFKARFDLSPYWEACSTRRVQTERGVEIRHPTLKPGEVLPIKMQGRHKWILCAATKDNWRNPSQLEWIERLISTTLPQTIVSCKIESIAIPALGCGLGGLDWQAVKELFERHQSKYPVKTFVIPPGR